ncbi:MAG TPA: DNA repair protein RadA [Gaiellaceae bacterium]|jgi:DNA repair protein RadA/Sms|nr:DNA repair protein RadA [Gaiellaceae bacterium]
MAKAAVQHACSECGYTTGKWLGRCPACDGWGTFVEERALAAAPGVRGAAAAGKPLLRLVEVETADAERIPTGVPELDRVLGGGLVPASLVLVSGDPGIGKSTLLLMALRSLSRGHKVVLVTGEESSAQVKLRADRLGGAGDVHILAETNLDEVCATLERERPEVCVVDSVQTLYAPELGSAPGSVGQVREAAGRFLRVSKEQGIATFLVGHVTKEGAVAGPRVLEHLVDCVLHFEGDRYRSHRILRAVKNRFGSTNELGVFEMTSEGLVAVEDPSELFGRPDDEQPGSAVVCTIEGTRPLLLEIQALVSPTDLAMPRRVGTGVDPKRLSMIVAVLGRHAGLALGQADVFVNVAGGVRIDEPGADLGVALAIASAARAAPVKAGTACFGEIGLTGRVRPVSQAERRLAECAKLGFSEALVPDGTESRGRMRLTAAASLRQAITAGLDASGSSEG